MSQTDTPTDRRQVYNTLCFAFGFQVLYDLKDFFGKQGLKLFVSSYPSSTLASL